MDGATSSVVVGDTDDGSGKSTTPLRIPSPSPKNGRLSPRPRVRFDDEAISPLNETGAGATTTTTATGPDRWAARAASSPESKGSSGGAVQTWSGASNGRPSGDGTWRPTPAGSPPRLYTVSNSPATGGFPRHSVLSFRRASTAPENAYTPGYVRFSIEENGRKGSRPRPLAGRSYSSNRYDFTGQRRATSDAIPRLSTLEKDASLAKGLCDTPLSAGPRAGGVPRAVRNEVKKDSEEVEELQQTIQAQTRMLMEKEQLLEKRTYEAERLAETVRGLKDAVSSQESNMFSLRDEIRMKGIELESKTAKVEELGKKAQDLTAQVEVRDESIKEMDGKNKRIEELEAKVRELEEAAGAKAVMNTLGEKVRETFEIVEQHRDMTSDAADDAASPDEDGDGTKATSILAVLEARDRLRDKNTRLLERVEFYEQVIWSLKEDLAGVLPSVEAE